MKFKSRFKREKVDIFKYLSILLIVIFIFFIPTIIKKIIKINKIECESQFGVCSDDLGLKLYEFTDYKIARKGVHELLVKNIQVNSFLIQYRIPNVLKVDVNLKKPKYAIRNANGNYFLVSRDGVVLNIGNETNLPVLERNEANYNVGDKINDKDRFALEIIEKVAWLYSKNNGAIVGNELKVNLNESVIARFPLEGDVDLLIGNLRLIFSRLNEGEEGIRMNDIREIDLRFKNPILR